MSILGWERGGRVECSVGAEGTTVEEAEWGRGGTLPLALEEGPRGIGWCSGALGVPAPVGAEELQLMHRSFVGLLIF